MHASVRAFGCTVIGCFQVPDLFWHDKLQIGVSLSHFLLGYFIMNGIGNKNMTYMVLTFMPPISRKPDVQADST